LRARGSSPSTTPERVTPARAASPPTSAPTASYVINTAAIAYMRAGNLAQDVIDKLAGHPSLVFESHEEWMSHLGALGLADWRVTPDPVRVASEAALRGAIEAEGLLGQAVIISDDAGQFRVGDHALCWVHAERLVHKLVPANDKQRNAVEVASGRSGGSIGA